MNKKNIVCQKFKSSMKEHFKNRIRAIIVYGSFFESDNSDFDACVIVNNFSNIDALYVASILEEIHKTYELRIDTEMAYLDKAIFDISECEKLGNNLPFEKDLDTGEIKINDFYDDLDYLKSKEARTRILLNVLTSNTTVLYGEDEIESLKKKYMVVLGNLVRKNFECSSLDELVSAFIWNPQTGAYYKDYLGYSEKDFDYLKKYVMLSNLFLVKQGEEYDKS